jgi:hypothetical protein
MSGNIFFFVNRRKGDETVTLLPLAFEDGWNNCLEPDEDPSCKVSPNALIFFIYIFINFALRLPIIFIPLLFLCLHLFFSCSLSDFIPYLIKMQLSLNIRHFGTNYHCTHVKKQVT